MTETVDRGHEIIFRLTPCISVYQRSQRNIIGISQKNRFYIRIRNTDMLHTVFFLFVPRQFVLFDYPVHIVLDRSSQHDAVLCPPVHGLCVNIIHGLSVFYQPAVTLKFGKILCPLFIHT